MTYGTYTVLVDNIGQVYDGTSYDSANRVYLDYVRQSRGYFGRVVGEAVALCRDGDPIQEYTPPCDCGDSGCTACNS